jgi:hypothetical protein
VACRLKTNTHFVRAFKSQNSLVTRAPTQFQCDLNVLVISRYAHPNFHLNSALFYYYAINAQFWRKSGSQGFVLFLWKLDFQSRVSSTQIEYTLLSLYAASCMQIGMPQRCVVFSWHWRISLGNGPVWSVSLAHSAFLDHALDNWHNGAVFLFYVQALLT